MRNVIPLWWVRKRHLPRLPKAHKFIQGKHYLLPLCARGSNEDISDLERHTVVKEIQHVAFCSLCFDIADNLGVLVQDEKFEE